MFSWVNPVIVASQKNTFTLTAVFGFNNKRLGFAFVKLLSKRLYICWQHPRFGEELVVVWEVLLDCEQVFS